MSFLLDTDICSAHLRGDRKVFSKFVQYSGQLHVSVITAGELYSWVLRSKAPADRLQLLQRFLMGVLRKVDRCTELGQFGALCRPLNPGAQTSCRLVGGRSTRGLSALQHLRTQEMGRRRPGV